MIPVLPELFPVSTKPSHHNVNDLIQEQTHKSSGKWPVLTLLFFMCFAVFPLAAQPADPFAPDFDKETGLLSFGVSDFDYSSMNQHADVPYLFDGSLYVLRLSSGNQGGVSLSYGTEDVVFAPETGGSAQSRVISFALETGGRKMLYQRSEGSHTSLYVPIKIYTEYMNLKYDFYEAVNDPDARTGGLNSIMLTAGTGLGFSYRPSRSFPVFSNRISIDGFATRSLGTNALLYNHIYTGAARKDNVKLQLSFLDLFSGFSFALAYQYQGADFREGGYPGFFSMLTSNEDFDSGFSSHMVTAGIYLRRR